MKCGAIILAAGSGFRMGASKQLFRIRREGDFDLAARSSDLSTQESARESDESLVKRSARIAIEAGCEPVIVVIGANHEAVAAEVAGMPVITRFNPDWQAGMGTSIRAGLAAALQSDARIDAVAVLVCDQPRLSANIVRGLIDLMNARQCAVAACGYAGTVGSPCCFGKAVFEELRNLPDAGGAKRLLRIHSAQRVIFPWEAGAEDLDTPADWEKYKSIF